MNIKKTLFVIVIIIVIILTSIGTMFGLKAYLNMEGKIIVDSNEYESNLEIIEKVSKFVEIKELIETNSLWNVDLSDKMDGIYTYMVKTLDDKYSEYLDEEALEELKRSLTNSFTGIGIVFVQHEEKGMMITEIIEGGPAELAGLLPGDIITKVDGIEYQESEEAANAIRGEAGSSVDITYVRGDAPETTITIVRGEITESTVHASILDEKIGYIRITSFGEETAEEFEESFSEFRDDSLDGIIIDLRNNPGGLLNEGVEIADVILGDCLIAYMENVNEERTEYYSDGTATDMKIVLLVNENTASTSELLTVSLMGHSAAEVVGTTTFGKGIVQETWIFDDNTGLKLTTHEYYGPNGEKIHGVGINPDHTVQLDFANSVDEQLEFAKKLILE